MTADLSLNMNDIDALLDLDSPYGYDDAGDYIDTASSSETTSPVMSNFDMSMIPELSNVTSSIYPSPVSSTRETASPQPSSEQKSSAAAAKPAAKRKRENRYKNAPPSVLSRRRAQNRASQRAYRERKDQRIKDLESMLSDQKQKNDSLSQAYSALHAEFLKLRGVQARAHQAHGHPQPMGFENQGIGLNPNVMDQFEGMFMFQDMPAYNL